MCLGVLQVRSAGHGALLQGSSCAAGGSLPFGAVISSICTGLSSHLYQSELPGDHQLRSMLMGFMI